MKTYTTDTEAGSLRADLQTLVVEIERIGPPDPNPGLFAPDRDHERLVTRWWETRRQFARAEVAALNRALLDSVRTLLALDGITDSRQGLKSAKHHKLARVGLNGLTINPDQFDETDIRLRRACLEKEFKKALRLAGEECDQ